MPLRREEVKVGAKYVWQPDFDGAADWPEEEVVTVVKPPLSATCCRAVGSPGPDTPLPQPDEYDWWVTIQRQDGTLQGTPLGRLSRREDPESAAGD